jgi:hypothetical protein
MKMKLQRRNRTSTNKWILVATSVLMAICACGRPPLSQGNQTSPHLTAASDDAFERRFEQPLPSGQEKASIDEAQKDAPFAILKPQLGTPKSVWLSTTEYQGKQGGSVALAYELAPYGKLLVFETLSLVDWTSRSAWENHAEVEVSNAAKPGFTGAVEFTTARGQRALLGNNDTGIVALELFESGIVILIQGPTISKAQAVSIAESMS